MIGSLMVVVGLKREAGLVTGPGIVAAVGGGDVSGLSARLERLGARQRPRAVVSVGLGGALSPGLEVGDWIVADRIVGTEQTWAVDAELTNELLNGLGRLDRAPRTSRRDGLFRPHPEPVEASGHGEPGGRLVLRQPRDEANASRQAGEPACVYRGSLAASNVMVVDAPSKAALHAATGALAVDMESHVAARFASAHGLPFAALRVISDGADRALPQAAQAGMKKDGGMDVLAVLKGLARDPRQLPALIRTGREAEVAFRQLALLNRHDLLGRLGVGDADLGELALDVV